MDLVRQQIITQEVIKKFPTEKEFYEETLNITQQSWNRWKRGERGFSTENMDRLKNLFTPYEWMIVDKVTDYMENDDQSMDNPHQVYLDTKHAIAIQWMKNEADITLEEVDIESSHSSKTQPLYKAWVKNDYPLESFSFQDVLSFDLENKKGKLKKKRKKRVQWLEKNQKNII